jgi:carboxymethylenebutenolidase
MAQYASLDTRVNEGWPAFEAILKKNKVEHTAYFYEGVNHGFHNNTTPRFDEKAATLSWKRTIDFFKEKLKKK